MQFTNQFSYQPKGKERAGDSTTSPFKTATGFPESQQKCGCHTFKKLTSGGQPALTDFALTRQTVLSNTSHQKAGARIHAQAANQDSKP